MKLKIDLNSEPYGMSGWQEKGILGDVSIITPEGKKFILDFMTKLRLNQDIDEYFNAYKLSFYHPGNNLIIVPDITEEIIIKTINDIYGRGDLKEPIFVESKT